jgi:DNA topoisomerase-1
MLPALTAEQMLRLIELLPDQHFTQPPPRYTEASLVKTLEENGVGRPSTYASIIHTLQERKYVRLEEKRFFPEDIGTVVSDVLVDYFPDIVDVGFTAKMEEELDDIADGQARWVEVLRAFYEPFIHTVEAVREGKKIQPPEIYIDELCPRCPQEGREPGRLQKKLGRFGMFIGCERYPECKFTRPLEGEAPEAVLLDEACPTCGKPLQERRGRFGPFVGCSGYPDCKYIKKEAAKRLGITCPECKQGELVERKGRFGSFFSCERYPDCTFSVNQQPQEQPCPDCSGLVVSARGGATRCIACHHAWDADGEALPEEKAQALIPKPRAARAASNGGRRAPKSKTRSRRSA